MTGYLNISIVMQIVCGDPTCPSRCALYLKIGAQRDYKGKAELHFPTGFMETEHGSKRKAWTKLWGLRDEIEWGWVFGVVRWKDWSEEMGGEERDMGSGETERQESTFKRESGWTLPDKKETASWNWKLNTPGRWISTHKNAASSRSRASVLQRPHGFSTHSSYTQSPQTNEFGFYFFNYY